MFSGAENFLKSRGGNFAILTALITPVFCIGIGGLFEAGMALSYRAQSERVLAMACERSIKPTRTLTPTDTARRNNVLKTFDALAKSANQTVVSRDATIDWLTTNMTASFSYPTTFAKLLNVSQLSYNLSYQCKGIPPYPHDGELLLSSALTKPDGSALKLKYVQTSQSPNGCWDVYNATDLGWDSGTGGGPEVQDWSNAYCRWQGNWVGLPPNDFPTPYAIELDSWNNSTMTKTIELHPGRYEVSVWYNGRNPAYEGSNEVYVSIQQTRPTLGLEKKVIVMAQNKNEIAWKKYSFTWSVSEYSVYYLTIGAGGKNDSVGGIITSFQLKYVDR